jgi:hypothetical protein
MVPVTTKPYLNSVNFTILQQGVPAFFYQSKKKPIDILLPVYGIFQLTSFSVFWFLKLGSLIPLRFASGIIPSSYACGINSSYASNFTLFVFSESH